MSELEQVLQQRIEQLETGEPLEKCLAGLPEPEANALRLIAAVRSLPTEEADEASIAAQRAALLEASAQKLKPRSGSTPSFVSSWLMQVQTRLDWLLSRRELAAGLAFIFIFALLGVVWLGLSRGEAGNETAVLPTDAQPTESVVEGDEPVSPVSEAGEETQEPSLGEGLPETADNITYLPLLSVNLNLNAQTAAVEVVAGLVQVQGTDGVWTAVNRVSTITAGQRVRTGTLSQATLTFFDGSQTRLHANTEISIDELNAQRPEQGFRTIVMTQHLGESNHSVQFRNDGGSRYEVNTPAGSGVARGTQFQVLVTPSLLARFSVAEGKVDVTGLSQMVSVAAGQTTAVLAGSPPQPPAFRITGEGEVSQIGPVWVIGGQSFQTHDQTIIIGNPQVGDLVYVEGRLLADGERVADRIILLRPPLNNRFTLTGEVEAITASIWTVAGQLILIDDQTQIDDDIEVGDRVQVVGVILPGGALQAREIQRIDDQPGFPFRFTGVVQAIGADSWAISGVAVAVNTDTSIDDDIVVGDVVEARGWILEDGSWLAQRITRVDDDDDDSPEFVISGRVQSIDPWQVAGISFEIREWTVIEPGIEVNDRVRVRGIILEDGTWVASTIDLIGDDDDDDDDDDNTVVLVGIVNSIDPWSVNSLQLIVTDDTLILGDIAVGDLVVVRIRLSDDGMWQVVSIRPLYPQFGLGCFVINTLVIGMQPNQLMLQGWPNLSLNDDDDDIVIDGNVETNGVVSFIICVRFDGRIIIISPIIVISPPIIIIVPPAPPPPPGGGGGNDNDNDND